MSNVTGVIRAKLVEANNPTIYNVPVALADTEYTQALSSSTKRFLIRVRGESDLKLSYALGDSSTIFLTIPKGASYSEDGLSFDGSLYFQTNKPGQVVEIVQWT